ncbi:polysaccharide pyruvyl transferase family protein [Natronosalvus caseinilyticus]|uniref:polysaccharide pyruvyl transferase family protein n=1 Tax=Natronosalvus caseinilyticus TaxID=2953747 RepID=UPI0028AEF3F3|nr:polysaccharide pyruvyl transferase family protein [Natronosalvus caseinilyticus]
MRHKNINYNPSSKNNIPKSEVTEITIINVFGNRNKGDAAIVLSMIDILEKRIGAISVNIESWHPDQDQDFYNADVFTTLWRYGISAPYIGISPLAIYEAIRKIPLLYSIKYNLSSPLGQEYLLRDQEQELFDRMKKSDLVLSCGGGFLHDSHGPAFLKHLYTLKMATLIDTPVMIYAQSIGPFRKKHYGSLACSVLNEVDYITVRDNISENYLEEIGVTDPPREVTADAAFLLEPTPPENNGILRTIRESEVPIGLTVRDWKYPNSDNPKKMKKQYRKEMSKYADYLQEELSATLFFFNHTPSDVEEAELITNSCDNTSEIHILDSNIPPRQLKYLTGEVELFVGTRMHSTIFSMEMDTPTISIPYLPKSKDLMERLGLKELFIDISQVNSRDLQVLTQNVIEDRTYQMKMSRGIDHLKSLTRRNAEIASSMIS